MEIFKIRTFTDMSESELKDIVEESWQYTDYTNDIDVNVVKLEKRLYRVELDIDLSELVEELSVNPEISGVI